MRRVYWDGLTRQEKECLARRLETSVGYLRQIFKYNKQPGALMARNIERETNGRVLSQELRPDIFLG